MVKGNKQTMNGSKKLVKGSKKMLKGKVTPRGHRTAPLKKISKVKLKFNDEPW